MELQPTKLNKLSELTLWLAGLCSVLAFSFNCYASTIIDDYDGNGIEGTDHLFGYGTWEISSQTAKSGRNSLKIAPSGIGWGCVVMKEFGTTKDFSEYSSISYWIRTRSKISAREVKIAVKLVFENGSEWIQNPDLQFILDSSSDDWEKISVPISDKHFSMEGGHRLNDRPSFTPESLSKIGIVVISVQEAVNIYFDDFAFSSKKASSPKTSLNAMQVDTQINNRPPPLNADVSFTGLIDDFVPPERYNEKHLNDVNISGTSTFSLTGTVEIGTSPELNHRVETDGVLSLSWSQPNLRWVTQLAAGDVDISSNNFLVLRMKSANPFTRMSAIFSSSTGANESIEIPTKLIKTKYATINLPLTTLKTANLSSIHTISFVFHDDSGVASLNQIGLSVCKRPSLIKLNFPGGTLINSGNNVLIEVSLQDEFGFPCSDFNSFIQLMVTNGFIYPNQISEFANGKARGIFTINGYGNQQLIAKDIISGVTDND